VIPSAETVNDGTYPIARPLFMYTAGKPTGALADYMDWVLTEGQTQVDDLGFVPLK
jgi:phosphate transport system substrate-binding protein